MSFLDSPFAVLANKLPPGLSFYGYVPTEWICILFIVLYAISTVTHLGQAFWYRSWWMIPTACFCGLLEILGWGARTWSSHSPGLAEPYEMQLTCTIIGPTPLIAATFVILGQIIEKMGTCYSRLTPKMYTIIFCSADLVSLVIQAVGGAGAARAVAQNTSAVKGGHIMLGGIAFQLTVITVYAVCGIEFFIRYLRDQPVRDPRTLHEGNVRRGTLTKGIKIQAVALVFMTTCLWIRSVYRVCELADGWTGRIIRTQDLFDVLDGAMVTLSIFTLNFAHPGLLLGKSKEEEKIIDSRKASLE